jgi:peptidyl-tRNA hydrolase
MYGIVNTDLNMSAGKIAAQFGHGVQKVVEEVSCKLLIESRSSQTSFRSSRTDKNTYYLDLNKKWQEWSQSSVKVVLGVNTEVFNYTVKKADELGIEGALIFDEARTELIKPDNTVFVLYPYRRDEVSGLVSQLSLLRTSDIVTGLQGEVKHLRQENIELRKEIECLQKGLTYITPGPLD